MSALDREQHRDAQARLEADYLRGAIDADEYVRLRARLAGPASAPTEVVRYASWGRRAAGATLDIVLLVALWVPVFIWVDSTEDPVTGEISDAAAFAFLFVFLIVPIGYGWLMIGRWGQTLGKMAVGEKVVRSEDAEPVGYARALGRLASAWLLGVLLLPLLLAYLWPIWDKRNQTLYDKMAGTIVVRVR